MKKPPIRVLITRQKQSLKTANPKSRDRMRHRLNVLLTTDAIRREVRNEKRRLAS